MPTWSYLSEQRPTLEQCRTRDNPLPFHRKPAQVRPKGPLVAIRKLMTSISRSQINVLFLDEVNQALDEQGKEKVVEVLLKEENLNTYLVSHGWTHPLLEKIEIIKEDNISRLD